MILLKENLIIFGGFSNSLLNDCYVLNLKTKYFQEEKNLETSAQAQNENLIFLNGNKLDTDFEKFENNLLSSLEKNEEIDDKKKNEILLNAFREELKLMNNQVSELKNKIENEINKNLCKVKFFFYIF